MDFLNEIEGQFTWICENESIDGFLLACSGGLDSVVLFHVMKELRLPFEVAHCNFNLRGSESDGDENFVRMLCRESNIPFHSESFNTTQHSEENKLSIQEAARELRYTFFNKICEQRNLQIIVTAHHLDDSVETFFTNLLRGTGLSGLKGIPRRRDAVFRPMLNMGRKDIAEYALQNKLKHREDSSNASDKYMRNQLRKLLTGLDKIKPQFRQILQRNMRYFQRSDRYLASKVKADIEMVSSREGNGIIEINKQALIAMPDHDFILYEYLSPFGFNESDIKDVVIGLQKNTNAVYNSSDYQLVRERKTLVLRHRNEVSHDSTAKINRNTSELRHPIDLAIELHHEGVNEIPVDNTKAFFNLNVLKFPLVVRKWHFGDKFQPLGMQGKKKISDFLTDLKVDRLVREQTLVVESGGEVIWVVGFRINEGYKVKDLNSPVFEIRLK